MASKKSNHIKLGVFVLAGLLFLFVVLYLIGQNQQLFGNTFLLRAHFDNVHGLIVGNNVRYAGIEVGTVRSIELVNDHEIEVGLVIKRKMRPFIGKTAVASIGSDGLIGNKVVNIEPVGLPGAAIEDGDLIASRKPVNTDDMLRTLDTTNRNIATISVQLKATLSRFNNSTGLWRLLNDSTIPVHAGKAIKDLAWASARSSEIANDLHGIVKEVAAGKGLLGSILRDTLLVFKLNNVVDQLHVTGLQTAQVATRLDTTIQVLLNDINTGEGTIGALLKDTALSRRLRSSLVNIDQGTAAFHDNMEALKHNFLLRGYFRRIASQQRKAVDKKDTARGAAALRE